MFWWKQAGGKFATNWLPQDSLLFRRLFWKVPFCAQEHPEGPPVATPSSTPPTSGGLGSAIVQLIYTEHSKDKAKETWKPKILSCIRKFQTVCLIHNHKICVMVCDGVVWCAFKKTNYGFKCQEGDSLRQPRNWSAGFFSSYLYK